MFVFLENLNFNKSLIFLPHAKDTLIISSKPSSFALFLPVYPHNGVKSRMVSEVLFLFLMKLRFYEICIHICMKLGSNNETTLT